MRPHRLQRGKPAIIRGIGAGLSPVSRRWSSHRLKRFCSACRAAGLTLGHASSIVRHNISSAEVPTAAHWLVAGAFHFGYAAFWGLIYTLLQRWRPAQPHVGGPLLGALIYAAAFSPWGAATHTGTEQPVERRHTHETLLHWTAALSYSLSLAYLFARIERWPRTEAGLDPRATARG